jgi:hypothetical protein
VLDIIINYLDKFGPELLVIQFGFLVILCTLFLWLWFSNRRKYNNLKHAIPATVVKSYLDSIIQNSTSLKSSLFRGGGLEVNGVPSVMPLGSLIGGDSMGISGAPSTALLEELNQKKALIAALEAQLSTANSASKELESNLNSTKGNLTSAENKIKELEALLGQSQNGGGDEALLSELSMVKKEREEFRDRLKEFEIISDDLANLKRLQQENEQLKRSLAALQGGPAPAAPAAPPVDPDNILSQNDVTDLLQDLGQTPESGSEETNALENFLSSPDDSAPAAEDTENAVAAAEDQPANPDDPNKSDRTPEDLLSEFEKMLG